MSKAAELPVKEQMKRLESVEKGYADLSEDASTVEVLEMIADAIGESFEEVHNRFMSITTIEETK